LAHLHIFNPGVIRKNIQRPPCPFNDFGKNRNPENDMIESSGGLCGVKPGLKSIGWDFENHIDNSKFEVTCPKCKKKLEKLVESQNNTYIKNT
jgi:hypothetical protein